MVCSVKGYYLLLLIPCSLFFSCEKKVAQPSSQSIIGANGAVIALTIYNGNLIAGGSFTYIGDIQSKYMAKWDGNKWTSLGYTGNDSITAFTTWNGNLIAGGYNGNIYQWNGSTWSNLRLDNGRQIVAMASYNGSLFACGFIHTNTPMVTYPFLEKWDGNKWSDLGPFSHNFGDQTAAMISYNGNLVVAGQFDSIGGISAKNIAQFDDSKWSPLGAGFTTTIFSMCTYNGNLVVSAYDYFAPNNNNLSQWDGNLWVQLNSPFNLGIGSLTTYNGNLAANGDYYDTQTWNGTTWASIGSGNYTTDEWPCSLQAWNGNLYLAGRFTSINGITLNNIAKWNGSIWSAVK